MNLDNIILIGFIRYLMNIYKKQFFLFIFKIGRSIVRIRTQVLFEEIKKRYRTSSHWWISGRNAPSWKLGSENGDDQRCKKMVPADNDLTPKSVLV
jgi:hypothetical protein